MKTHKDALYIRKPGDKLRPAVLYRPTLRQVAARLRQVNRRITMKSPPALIAYRDRLVRYLKNVAVSTSIPPEKLGVFGRIRLALGYKSARV